MTGLADTGIMYLASLRMYMTDEKYLAFIANNSEYYDASLALESKMNKAMGNFEASRENTMLSALKIYKDEGNVASYYDQIDKVILRLKDEYLKMVTD